MGELASIRGKADPPHTHTTFHARDTDNVLDPEQQGVHPKFEAAKKENPLKDFTWNPRGPRTEHLWCRLKKT